MRTGNRVHLVFIQRYSASRYTTTPNIGGEHLGRMWNSPDEEKLEEEEEKKGVGKAWVVR